jgi:hypothetical protein
LVARLVLPDAVPMNAGAIIVQVVVDCDFEPISPTSSDDWSWILVVDQHDPSLPSTIGIDRSICDVQCVWHRFSSVWPLFVEVGRDRKSIALDKLVYDEGRL